MMKSASAPHRFRPPRLEQTQGCTHGHGVVVVMPTPIILLETTIVQPLRHLPERPSCHISQLRMQRNSVPRAQRILTGLPTRLTAGGGLERWLSLPSSFPVYQGVRKEAIRAVRSVRQSGHQEGFVARLADCFNVRERRFEKQWIPSDSRLSSVHTIPVISIRFQCR